MLTIRLTAARCEAIVEEAGRVAARVEFDPKREDHRAGVVEMVENRLRQREKEG